MVNIFMICTWLFCISTNAVPLFLPQYLHFKTTLALNQSALEQSNLNQPLETGFIDSKLTGTSNKQIVNLSLQFCPDFCNCQEGSSLQIVNCSKDPADVLDPLLNRNLNASGLVIKNSSLSRLPLLVCKMAQLNSIDVSSNKITNLPWECLKKLKYLSQIVASENHISKLENGSFYDFHALNKILIAYNSISQIDVDVFIQQSRMSFDLIDLSYNNIKSLDPWPAMYVDKNPTINLRGNKIHEFTNRAHWHFKCQSKTEPSANVVLNENNITHFSDLFNGWNVTDEVDRLCTLTGEGGIDISENPFVCDCIDYEVYKFFKLVKKGNILEVTCKKPDYLYGKRIVSLPLDDFICHVQKDCPEKCDCIDQPNQMNMSVDCKEKGINYLPVHLPFLPKHNYKYKLNFLNNNITFLDHRQYFKRAHEVLFSYNRIRNISLATLEALSNATSIYLDNNKLQFLPKNISNVYISGETDVHLASNEWICDCNAIETRLWMVNNRKVISDSAGILCNSPHRLKGSNLLLLSEDELICGDPPNKELYGYFGIGGSALFICLVVISLFVILRYKRVWFYRRFSWHPFDWDECENENKVFDVFVSYSNDDEEYVGEYLIPNLERKGYKVAYHRVHFPGGQPITVSIEECIRKSKRTLALFSKNFMDSEWCMWEFTVALEMDGNAGTHRLVAIKYEDIVIDSLSLTLQAYFKRYTYIERESHVFWDNLEYSLPVNKMGTSEDHAFNAADRDSDTPQMENEMVDGEDEMAYPLIHG